MDLQAIRTFCRAVEAGNLTAAAKALHITKSVASRRCQSLEDGLGVKLLARNTKGVTPTDEGALFYERGIRILDDVEDAAQAVKHTSDNLVGTLRFTAPRSFADLKLGPPLMAFAQQHPGLKLEMNLTDERVDIIGGGFDLGLRIAPELSDTSLIARKICDIRHHVVASPAYLEAHGTPKTPEDLKDHNCVFYSNVEAAKQWRFGTGNNARAVRVTGQVTSNSGLMQLAAAVEGVAIATLPDFFLEDAVRDGKVIKLFEDVPRAPSYLYALYPERRLLPLKVRLFIDFMADWFAVPENHCEV
ncbi:LysR family transcriptional regulator [Kordiimonas lacus]|uniref:DNA-binding transcriptional regulator, LysR family n=1 Tax=Kordiimonas lacus TaxID=637679 RepID=A0A1G6TAF6_9PROT|nr:LysR family transcriptional regulator [Kordiimonas lacus]SDD25546.1 DNA-binding transcriptional regulator, LysR family [Kordiimonas lacus]